VGVAILDKFYSEVLLKEILIGHKLPEDATAEPAKIVASASAQ
jgi:hypothetical protein